VTATVLEGFKLIEEIARRLACKSWKINVFSPFALRAMAWRAGKRSRRDGIRRPVYSLC
jgi:hypothetical protein